MNMNEIFRHLRLHFCFYRSFCSSFRITLTFCLYSSTTASISVELSDSVRSKDTDSSSAREGSASVNIDVSAMSCELSSNTVFRGDCGSPNKSHSSSGFGLTRDLDLGNGTALGLLKNQSPLPEGAVDVADTGLAGAVVSKRLYACVESSLTERQNQNFLNMPSSFKFKL